MLRISQISGESITYKVAKRIYISPGKSNIICKLEVISICSIRITTDDVLNILILWIWEEMTKLQKGLYIKNQ